MAGWDDMNGAPAVLNETSREPTELDLLFARVFSNAEGRKVIKYLRETTIEQPCWVPGADPSHGFMREGQNALVRYIEARIRAAEQP